MKKSLIYLFFVVFLISIIFSLTGCDNNKNEVEVKTNNEIIDNSIEKKEQVEVKETEKSIEKTEENAYNEKNKYFAVLEGIELYTNEDNEQVKFDKTNKKVNYALLDMDDDKKDEMVIQINNEDLLILNLENNTVYGFEVVLRGLLSLKTDGTYIGSGGAESSRVLKSNFSKNVRTETVLAKHDIYDSVPDMIADKKVTAKEVEEYYNEFHKKQDVTFVEYKQDNSNSNNQKVEESKKLQFKEGNFIYKVSTGAENDGSIHSLKFQNGNVIWEDNYFDDSATGTYSINGDKIVVNFTLHKGFNQSTDSDYEEKINKSITYTIVSDNEIKGYEPYGDNKVVSFSRK